jgi:DNA-binding NarL/FixJ family response regulator
MCSRQIGGTAALCCGAEVCSRKLEHMGPISVLVMDSNPTFLRFVVQYLEEQPGQLFNVAGAAFREADALVLAGAAKPQVALVGMSGPISSALDLMADLQRRLPALAVVAMSQLGEAGYSQAALEAGATAFVDKDRLRIDLVSAIVQAVCSSMPTETLP